MGRVEDKVVLITGGARGQGRSHAVKLAEEGADVILFDICHDIDTNEYPLATSRDLEEAGLEVEKTGRKAYTAEVDVRDRAALNRELANAVAEFGKLDVVVANAGICPLGTHLPVQAFADAFDVDFVGVVNTVHAALPYLKSGASIITTGSVGGLIAGLQPPGAGGPIKPSKAQFVKALAFAKCMRTHGLPRFPDPLASAPRGSGPIVALGGMLFKPGQGLDPQSPAFQEAASRCGVDLPKPPG